MVLWLPCAFFVLFLDPVDKVFLKFGVGYMQQLEKIPNVTVGTSCL